MFPYKLYNEFSTENFGETEFIYSCEGLSYTTFKTGLDEGKLAIRVNTAYAQQLIKNEETWKLASWEGRVLYLLQHYLSPGLVVLGVLFAVGGIAGVLATGWWLGLACVLGGFFTTRYSQQAAHRFQLSEALEASAYYEAANRLSNHRLFMVKVCGGISPR